MSSECALAGRYVGKGAQRAEFMHTGGGRPEGGDCQHSGGGTAGEDNTRGGGQERDLRDAVNFTSMKLNS